MILAHTTSRVQIEVGGVIRRQYRTTTPLTLSEVWHHERLRQFGPGRQSRLSLEGVAILAVPGKMDMEMVSLLDSLDRGGPIA